jgi:alpha-L-fucosidase
VLPHNEWRVTTQPGKLYFTFFQEPRAPFEFPPMKNAVKRAYYLAGGKPVEVKEENGRRQLIVPRPIVDPMATVIVIEIEGGQVER